MGESGSSSRNGLDWVISAGAFGMEKIQEAMVSVFLLDSYVAVLAVCLPCQPVPILTNSAKTIA